MGSTNATDIAPRRLAGRGKLLHLIVVLILILLLLLDLLELPVVELVLPVDAQVLRLQAKDVLDGLLDLKRERQRSSILNFYHLLAQSEEEYSNVRTNLIQDTAPDGQPFWEWRHI